jgi:hypothetical protein
MASEMYITQTTFYNYRAEIFYRSSDDGMFGFFFRLFEGQYHIVDSAPIYKTALEAGHGALSKLEEIHNEKD